MSQRVLEMKEINKSFPGVHAVNNVDLFLEKGEVLGLIGENGAGKSTLIKVLSGAFLPDSGSICIEGENFSKLTPLESIAKGVSVIYQELNYVNSLSIAENIFIGRLPRTRGTIDYKKLKEDSLKIQNEVGLGGIYPFETASSLSVAQKQLLEIARAFARNAKIIVMDEPTAALTENEIKLLYKIIRDFVKKGGSVIYITHKLDEIFDITDSVMVMRDAKNINRWETSKVNKQEIITAMVGREIKDMYPVKPREIKEKVFEVINLSTDYLKDISFDVRAGEIVGLYGLMGSGCEEITACIYGLAKYKTGKMVMMGNEVKSVTPSANLKNNIAYVPSERKALGLVLGASLKDNISMANMKAIKKSGLLNYKKEALNTWEWMKKLKIVAPDVFTTVNSLSGGNQQKVVLAKSMNANPMLLILNEPTRGVDVGAKVEIYKLMEEFCKLGVGIIMVSSEMPETMAIADRIIAVYEGKITAEFTKNEVNQLDLMKASIGEYEYVS